MNRLLETSQTPFGVVVRDLNYRRRNLAVVRPVLDPVAGAAIILQHRAVLVDQEGAAFSLVVENYTRAMIEDLRVRP